ncbi:hypothetical protein [Streptomyces roseifaciens]|uniref:hypothetical protein n=1 Tax=Streptomyces roseifaciens TaxID=1488406 RepID=UPI0007182CBF|nr:hypothetical protein [Streptomyces roseifaciens]
MTVTIAPDSTAPFLPGTDAVDPLLPVEQMARALQEALAQHQIRATVRTVVRIEPALEIALATAQDAMLFAFLVLAHLSDVQAAALRLRTVWGDAGIEAPDVRATESGVDIGDISAADAARLWRFLGGDQQAGDVPLDSYEAIHDLTDRLRPLLAAAAGGFIDAIAKPVCADCADSRPDRIALGRATASQALLLADAIRVDSIRGQPS